MNAIVRTSAIALLAAAAQLMAQAAPAISQAAPAPVEAFARTANTITTVDGVQL